MSLEIRADVREALGERAPVVALESTLHSTNGRSARASKS